MNNKLGLIATLGAVACSCQSKEAPKPNVIYILADDMGYAHLSCYGQSKFQTPNIDRLADEGMRFTQHYSGCPVSAPSRCVLMTGKHTGHCTVRGNTEQLTGKRPNLLPEDVTIAQVLKDRGYATGIFGKWGLGVAGQHATPLKKGFDHFLGFLDQKDAHSHYPPRLDLDEGVMEIVENADSAANVYGNDLFTAEAKKFIRENKDKPFFIYLPYTIPHAEILVPEDDRAPFDGKFGEETPWYPKPGATYRESPTPYASFAGMITRMDRHIGEIMALLKELGIDDNTIVMFSSDNGPAKEGGADPVFFDATGGLRGIKRDMYEGGMRIPFIARWPGKIPAGAVNDHVAAFYDIMPTLCEVSGAKVPAGADGISILPTLTGNDAKQKKHDVLYWEFHVEGKGSNGQTYQAVRLGDYKVVRYGFTLPTEVYDIAMDYKETNDLAAAMPELVTRGEELFRTMHTPSEQFPSEGLDFPVGTKIKTKDKKDPNAGVAGE